MAGYRKLGRTSSQRKALLRNPDTTVYANHSMLLDFVFRNSFRIYILYIYYSEETRKKQVPFLKQSSSTIPSEAQTATTAAQIAEHVRQTDFQA